MVKDSRKQEEEIENLTAKWKRALADYQNLEKRIMSQKQDFIQFANSGLILKILPALDSLEKAEAYLRDAGLTLAVKQLRDILAGEGLERIEVLGKEFNPEEMECLEIVSGKENNVVEEIKRGYRLKGKILRYAQVKVGKRKVDQKAGEQIRTELQRGDYV